MEEDAASKDSVAHPKIKKGETNLLLGSECSTNSPLPICRRANK